MRTGIEGFEVNHMATTHHGLVRQLLVIHSTSDLHTFCGDLVYKFSLPLLRQKSLLKILIGKSNLLQIPPLMR